jgi:hypothetical protein
VVFCGVALRLFAADRNTTSEIAAEIHRLEARKMSPSDPGATALQTSLKSAAEALRSERLYLTLERLLQAIDLSEGAAAVNANTGAVAKNLGVFETEWARTGAELATISGRVRAKNWDRSPAAIRALSETALGRSVPLLDGGRGFAVAKGPKDGLFYLGEARGQVMFASFCGSLPFARKKARWPARSLMPELLDLQSKTDAAFQPPRSIEQHARFIALNSTLKLARELDSTRSYYGALYQYLEALRHYAMLDGPPVEAGRQKELTAAIDAQIKQLAASGRDESIPQLFLERAAAQTTHPDGSAPSADEWRSAETILNRVLPAYSAVMKAAPKLSQSGAKTVNVTLVRWPYT